MKGKTFLTAAVALMVSFASFADDSKKDAPTSEKSLAMEEGTWDAEMTLYPPGGEAAVMKSKATETNVMVGKWLISDFKGEIAGQPFQGHGQTGFDAKKGKYIGTWVDSVSTHISIMEGTYDAATKTLTMSFILDEPQLGKPMAMKIETLFKGDTRVFTESMKPEGAKDFVKMMEITYTKKAK